MNCKKCNQEIDDNVKFCPVCGADQNEAVTNTVAAEVPVQEATQTEIPPQTPLQAEIPQPDAPHVEAAQPAPPQPEAPQQEIPQSVYTGGTATQGNTAYGYTNNNPNSTYQTMEKPINTTTYMVLSILTTICCCLPLGIVSIVFASKISSAQNAGQFAEAQESAKKAKMFMIIGLIVGIITNILSMVYIFSIVGSGAYYYY